MDEIYLSRYDRNSSVEPPEMVAQDIVDRLLVLEVDPLCPVCRQEVPQGGCIHPAAEALAIWEARRG